MMNEILRAAHWSDTFFNGDWVPDDPTNEESLTEAAREFLRLFPDCPYDAAWLVRDFKKRL